MGDPPPPTFPPRRGLTPEERRKVGEWIREHGVTECPAVGSPELAAIEMKKYEEWLRNYSLSMKIKVGYVPLKRPERTEKDRRERKREYDRDRHRRKKEQE